MSAHPARPPSTAEARTLKAGALLQVGAALVWIPQAALIAHAVDRAARGAFDASILPVALGVLILGLVRASLDAAGTRLAFRAARAQVSALRRHAVEALAATSPLAGGRIVSGRAASLMAEQAEAILPYRSRFLPARMKATFVPLVLLAAVAAVSWLAALVLLVAAPLIPVFMALVGWRAKAASEAQLQEMGGMNAFLLDRLRGLATIRTLGAVDATALRLRDSAQDLRTRTMAVLRIAFLSSAVLELFSALGVAMVAVYVGFHLLGTLEFGAWGGQLSLGEGLFVLMLAPAFFDPLRELSAVWHDRAAGQAAEAALGEVDAPRLPLPGALMRPAPFANATGAPEVVVEDLRFAHGSESAVLDQFQLAVAPGERVAIMGPSGSGKSTLLSLIAALAPPDVGTVRIGGIPLSEETATLLRSRISWIGQRPHFFAGSLKANITMGRTGLSEEAARAAMQFAALDTLARTHGGLSGARIGESAAGLSGGEALRLALARAAAAPHADLILADEPTAHLDATTAAQVTEGLLALAKGRTLIVATHDPDLAARMDRIVHLAGEPQAGRSQMRECRA
ncbi:thiol reductant ABC exporter subunit CydD [Aquabacter sp. L1I39]|uniref:thiol reductant ABC exporter subunit CydD n=1 Tax=Aquabacter sp. L1I39 TaxID=2820278 RepID=UPI001ADB39C1|nr:thiol reductant ABC exporter subunit CydD [Aquabacter sp. L1I39]QTL05654.1 thiol reductant ABC exporter subunit CydD [Aquabacter sp. L1I39]